MSGIDDIAGGAIAVGAIAGLVLNLAVRLVLLIPPRDRSPGAHLKDGKCHLCRRHVWPWRVRWAAWWCGEELPQPLWFNTGLIVCKDCEGV